MTAQQEREACATCQGVGWVCENHPSHPWAGMTGEDECCGGAGAPCAECNPLSRGDHIENKG